MRGGVLAFCDEALYERKQLRMRVSAFVSSSYRALRGGGLHVPETKLTEQPFVVIMVAYPEPDDSILTNNPDRTIIPVNPYRVNRLCCVHTLETQARVAWILLEQLVCLLCLSLHFGR